MSLRRSGSSISELMDQVPMTPDNKSRKLALSDYIEHRYPYVDYEINMESEDTVREGTLLVLKKIFPDVTFTDYKLTQFTDGLTNKLFKIAPKSSNLPPVLVRVYGKNTEMLIDRDQEILTMELLNESGIAPPIYGRFRNGLCYGFAEGKTFSVEDMKCATKMPLVAKELARFHAVDVVGSAYREPSVFMTILNWIDVASEAEANITDPKILKAKEGVPPLQTIVSEFEKLRDELTPLLPQCKVCFCHNDLLCKNILYHENGNEIQVQFIDYEYGHYNFAAFDIGNHFNEMMGYEVNEALYPSEDFQLQFIHEYVSAFRDISSFDHSKNPNHNLKIEEEVNLLYIQANKFALMSHLFWAIWARVQAVYSDISEVDYYDYSNLRFNSYLSFKEKFVDLGK